MYTKYHVFHILTTIYLAQTSSSDVRIHNKGKSGDAVINTTNAVTMRKSQMTKLLDEMRFIQESQQRSIEWLRNTTHYLLDRIIDLEEKIKMVSDDGQNFYKSTINMFDYQINSVSRNKMRKGTCCKHLYCPMTTCFRKSIASNVRSKLFSEVNGITSLEGCGMLSSLTKSCEAIYYSNEKLNCYLSNHVKYNNNLVSAGEDTIKLEFWMKSSTPMLHKCSSNFDIKYKASYYKFVRSKVSWKVALRKCQEMGGSLAELTTYREIYFIKNQPLASSIRYWHVGGIQNSPSPENEPAGGWQWLNSKIPIPSPGFRWKNAKPDNYLGDEHYMNGQVKNGKLYFNDLSASYEAHGFLCECQTKTVH